MKQLKDPMRNSIRNILLPEYEQLGFREYKTRSIGREISDFFQIISFIKLRSNWHRICYATYPLFQPLRGIGFGEPGGCLLKQVSGANHQAAENSMKNALIELKQKANPLFDGTSTIHGFYNYSKNLPIGVLSVGGSSLLYLALVSAKLGYTTDAINFLRDPVFNTEFWKSHLKDFLKALESGETDDYLEECIINTKITLKI
jgi:hypothetical protein